MNILIVDDEKLLRDVVREYCLKENYKVYEAENGIDALKVLENNSINLIVLDIMMPKMDGFSLCKQIKDKNIPIIILSARTDEFDKLMGFDLGIEDYVTKPFNTFELLARVKSQLRRYMTLGNYVNVSKEDEKVIKSSGLEINLESKEVFVEGESIRVTATEFGILELLLKNKGRVFSIDEIYENVWKEPSYNAENTVAVHIRRIREKIEINPKEPKYLKVVWGIGYKIEKYE